MATTYKTIEYFILDGQPCFDPDKLDEAGEVTVLDVEFNGNPEWTNDGIGSYEYFGYKGFDKGVTYPTMENSKVEWNSKEFSPEANSAIEAWLDENLAAIQTSLCESFENEHSDY